MSTRVQEQALKPRDAGRPRCSCLRESAEERPEHDSSHQCSYERCHQAGSGISLSAWQLLQILCFGTNSLRVLHWEPAHLPPTSASIRGAQIQTAQHRVLEHLCSSGDSGLLKDLILDCFQYDHSPFKEKSKRNLRASNGNFVFSSAPFILA